MSTPTPAVGAWYQTEAGDTLEVVAIDTEEGAVEVQFYDGTIEEYDLDTWDELNLERAEPPEDWSGSLDISADDYGVDLDRPAGTAHSYGNPLDDLPAPEED